MGESHTDVRCVEANRVIELTLDVPEASATGGGGPAVAFTDPEGVARVVPAFRDAEGAWKVRYASPRTGAHRYAVVGEGERGGPGEAAGRIEVVPYTGENPLYRHGPVRVGEDRRHLVHADGRPLLWLGDTWWMGLCGRLPWPEGFRALAADRKAKGFTVVQIVAGLYPDMPPFDPRGANEAGQAWTAGYGEVRPEYFDRADERILYLVEEGLIPCIVGAWHQHMPLMGPEKMQRHWRELIARWSALPVVWCLGGEINAGGGKPRKHRAGLEPVIPTEPDALRAAWTETARYVQAADPFDRVLGTHNIGSLHVLDDDSLLDMYFMQTGHSGLSSVQCGLEWFRARHRAVHRAPMILAEGNYQWLWAEGNFDDPLQRHQFWTTMLAGAAGHTYGANGIWQVNREGKPFGPSPHGFNWGTTPWDVAMNHEASRQLGACKRFLQSLPWTKLRPVGNARFADPPLEPIRQTGAKWIRPPRGEQRMTLLGATFDLPEDAGVRRAAMRLACGAARGLTINGQMVVRTNKLDYREEHAAARLLPAAGEYLRAGRNRILIRFDGEAVTEGEGLLAHLSVELTDGTLRDVVTDASWRWARPDVGWPGDVIVLDPAGWEHVAEVQAPAWAGDGPVFGTPDAHGPQAAATGEGLWLVYVPTAYPVELSGLPPSTALERIAFNPRTGLAEPPRPVETDPAGRWVWQPPSGHTGDAVLVIR